jgi:transcription initiation factor IIE alpha subunit
LTTDQEILSKIQEIEKRMEKIEAALENINNILKKVEENTYFGCYLTEEKPE